MVMDSRRALESPRAIGQGDGMMEEYANNYGIPLLLSLQKLIN